MLPVDLEKEAENWPSKVEGKATSVHHE